MNLQERREWLMRQLGMGIVLATIAMVAFQTAGCGGPKRPLVEVRGKILFEDGTPLPPGTKVILEPMEGRVQAASGETAADGSFSVQHLSGKAGAELGKYRVRLAPPKDNPDNFFKLVPDSYVDGMELFLEVRQGMGEVTLQVKRRLSPS